MAFDLEIGAATIFMEASNQGAAGQSAVAHVLVNRMRTSKWGGTIASVCLWPAQFSCWNTQDTNRKRMATTLDSSPIMVACQKAMREALDGVTADPTSGACFYFTDGIEPPPWASAMRQTAKIGRHIFFAEK